MKRLLSRGRADFLAGLAIVLPAVISIALVLWLFGTVSNLTDMLLFFLPREWTHFGDGQGPVRWYWSIAALLLAAFLVGLVGRLARYYLGRKIIHIVDIIMLRVPLLNKIYAATKQVNEALTSNKRTAFKQVVLFEYPRRGSYSIGFITGEEFPEIQERTKEQVVCVFLPTTPNPTSGYLMLIPEEDVIRLNMSVAEAIKFIISLGSIAPEYISSNDIPYIPGVFKPADSVSGKGDSREE
ncbi:MAG: DUF502 domain-containing protein [Verrucomicrobia bacterium]|nr:DUF502 domain-containing protein [Verrucomicrobiota bacterium]